MYRYSMTQWITGKEPFEKTVERLKTLGYDAIELSAEPESNIDEICKVLSYYSLPCSSLCGIFPPSRDLASSDEKTRRNAVDYVKGSIDMAVQTGCKTLIVVPSAVGANAPDENYQISWKTSQQSLKEAAEYAESRGVYLALEAINRFETYLVNNISTSRRFVEEVNHPNLKMMADLFHMNIEERNIADALNEAAPYLIHMHLADNTREPIGMGQIELQTVFKTLNKIHYEHFLTMEFMPRVSNPYMASEQEGKTELFDKYAGEALTYCRTIEKAVKII